MSGGAVKFRPISPPLQGRAAKLGSLLPSCSGWGPTASREADRPHPNPSPEGEGLIACSFGARRIRSARMTTTDPFALFDAWFAEARASEPNDSNAMALATATPDGRPSVRMVLLKGHGPDGFVFYTNLASRKGGELAANPQEIGRAHV